MVSTPSIALGKKYQMCLNFKENCGCHNDFKSHGGVIYQTRGTVFHRDIQTPRRELKIRSAAEYF